MPGLAHSKAINDLQYDVTEKFIALGMSMDNITINNLAINFAFGVLPFKVEVLIIMPAIVVLLIILGLGVLYFLVSALIANGMAASKRVPSTGTRGNDGNYLKGGIANWGQVRGHNA
jgi:hypothetical protein